MSQTSYEISDSCQIPCLESILSAYLGVKDNGIFVEVGAYDGKSFSNTWGLSRAGWKGLYIEGVPEFMDACRANHAFNSKILFEQCCATDHDGEGKMYTFSHVSTILLNEWSRQWGPNENSWITVPFRTMNTILAKHDWPTRYDLLVIDVEEAELQVLAGYDLSKWKPTLIIIELHETVPGKNWKVDPVTSILHHHGYHRIYGDHINTIFALNAI